MRPGVAERGIVHDDRRRSERAFDRGLDRGVVRLDDGTPPEPRRRGHGGGWWWRRWRRSRRRRARGASPAPPDGGTRCGAGSLRERTVDPPDHPGQRREEGSREVGVIPDQSEERRAREPQEGERRLRDHGRRPWPTVEQGDLAEVVAGDQPMDGLASGDDLRLTGDRDEERVSRLALLDRPCPRRRTRRSSSVPATFLRCRLDSVSNSGTAAMTASSFAFANVTSSGTQRGKPSGFAPARVGDRGTVRRREGVVRGERCRRPTPPHVRCPSRAGGHPSGRAVSGCVGGSHGALLMELVDLEGHRLALDLLGPGDLVGGPTELDVRSVGSRARDEWALRGRGRSRSATVSRRRAQPGIVARVLGRLGSDRGSPGGAARRSRRSVRTSGAREAGASSCPSRKSTSPGSRGRPGRA